MLKDSTELLINVRIQRHTWSIFDLPALYQVLSLHKK